MASRTATAEKYSEELAHLQTERFTGLLDLYESQVQDLTAFWAERVKEAQAEAERMVSQWWQAVKDVQEDFFGTVLAVEKALRFPEVEAEALEDRWSRRASQASCADAQFAALASE